MYRHRHTYVYPSYTYDMHVLTASDLLGCLLLVAHCQRQFITTYYLLYALTKLLATRTSKLHYLLYPYPVLTTSTSDFRLQTSVSHSIRFKIFNTQYDNTRVRIF